MQLRMTQRGGQRLGPLLFISGSVEGHNLQNACVESRRNCRGLHGLSLLTPDVPERPQHNQIVCQKVRGISRLQGCSPQG
jgi:hypothetical protein